MTESRYPCYIIIGGVQNYFTNMMAFGQAQVLPCFTIIVAFINTNTTVRRTAAVYFAGAYPNGFCLPRLSRGRPVYSNISNGKSIFLIKNRGKALPVGISVPQSTTCVGYIKFCRVIRIDFYVHHPSIHLHRANIAKGNIF